MIGAALQLLVAIIAIASLVYSLVSLRKRAVLDQELQSLKWNLGEIKRDQAYVRAINTQRRNGAFRSIGRILNSMREAKKRAIESEGPAVVHGGTVAGWYEALMGDRAFLALNNWTANDFLRRRYGIPVMVPTDDDIEYLAEYEIGIRWLWRQTKNDRCSYWFWVLSQYEKENIIQELSEILRRINERKAVAT